MTANHATHRLSLLHSEADDLEFSLWDYLDNVKNGLQHPDRDHYTDAAISARNKLLTGRDPSRLLHTAHLTDEELAVARISIQDRLIAIRHGVLEEKYRVGLATLLRALENTREVTSEEPFVL